jgi:hypothetical protein
MHTTLLILVGLMLADAFANWLAFRDLSLASMVASVWKTAGQDRSNLTRRG